MTTSTFTALKLMTAFAVSVATFATAGCAPNEDVATADESNDDELAAPGQVQAAEVKAGPGSPRGVWYADQGPLWKNHELRSRNGNAVLAMQGDGNLVIYVGGRATWSTRTNGMGPTLANVAVLKTNGEFVVYASNTGKDGRRWSSGTAGHNSAYLELQDNGTLNLWASYGRYSDPPIRTIAWGL